MSTTACNSFETIIAVQVSFPVSDAPLHNLRRAAKRRQRAAHRPGTRANQRCQLSCYLTFCLTHGLDYVDPSEDTLCLYVEYLAQRFTNPKSVTNYFSAIQLFHNLSGVAASNIHGFQYRTMLRALPLTMRHTPLQRLPIDPRLLAAICRVCDNLSAMGIVLKLAFLVAFFGFLRQSNLAPPSPRTFDPSRHTTRGDVTLSAGPRFGHQIEVEQDHAGGRHSSSHPHSSHPGSSPRSRGRIPGYVTPSAHPPPQGAPADTTQWQSIVRVAAPAGPQRTCRLWDSQRQSGC